MPGINGIKFIWQIKAMDGDAATIIITDHGDTDIATETLRLGAVDFILKPIDIERLENSISLALAKFQKKQAILQYIE